MNVERTPPAGERSRTAVVLVAASFLSILLGFRLGMNREDAVGYGLQVPAPGIDLSYTYAMNRASAEGRVFGRDFVSTYGPFGYCIAAMDVPGIVTPWILSQLFLTVALGLAAAAYSASVGGRLVSIITGIALLLAAIHVSADEYRWLGLVVLLVLLGLRAKGRRALAVFATAGLLAGFAMLIKLSLGSGALLTVGAAAFLARPWRAIGPRVVAASISAAAGLGLGLWLHHGSLDGLVEYLRTAAAVTNGYSSAMSLAEPDWWKAAVAFGVFAACLGAALIAPGRPHLRVVAATLVAPTFLAWKHGVVRQDGHVKILVLFGLVLVAVALVEIAGASGLRPSRPWLVLAAVALARVWVESPDVGSRPLLTLGETVLEPLLFPGVRGLLTLTALSAHRADLERESAATLVSQRLPEAARALIGSRSVDVYPWETSYAAANAFDWSRRPSPASFATYTPELDRLDAAFFEGPSRPSFILWHTDTGVRSIDRRHLFWDEPLTFRTLLDRYDLAWQGERVPARGARRASILAPGAPADHRRRLGPAPAPAPRGRSAPGRGRDRHAPARAFAPLPSARGSGLHRGELRERRAVAVSLRAGPGPKRALHASPRAQYPGSGCDPRRPLSPKPGRRGAIPRVSAGSEGAPRHFLAGAGRGRPRVRVRRLGDTGLASAAKPVADALAAAHGGGLHLPAQVWPERELLGQPGVVGKKGHCSMIVGAHGRAPTPARNARTASHAFSSCSSEKPPWPAPGSVKS